MLLVIGTSRIVAHGSGRVLSASESETSVHCSTPASAIIYDACTSIIKKKKNCDITVLLL